MSRTTSLSTFAVFSHDDRRRRLREGRPAEPAHGPSPRTRGSGGRPRRRQSVGATSKTLALARSFDGTTAGPSAAIIPGSRCQRNAVSNWTPEEDAGRSGTPLEAVVGRDDERRPVAPGLRPELPEDPVRLDVDRVDGVPELA